ncbi:MAG: HK97 gp10 family phage protein [Defluviitaleaceae bacterium]|nr:HK97 gp10 family phage protein [Defluviitaleaceae bacterium]
MIEGLDELLDEFDDLSDETLDALRMGLDKGLKRTVALAKQLAPVRDGQLRNSITSYTERMGQEIEGTVIAGAAHAVYVEMGTGDRGHGADNGKAPGATYTAGWPGQEPEP